MTVLVICGLIVTLNHRNSCNSCHLTINCDTGQHSQFLRCLLHKFKAHLKLTSQFKHSLNLDIKYAAFSKSVFDQNSFNKLETSKNFWWMLSNSPVFAKALKYITVWREAEARSQNPQMREWKKCILNKCGNKRRNVNVFFFRPRCSRFVQSSVQKVWESQLGVFDILIRHIDYRYIDTFWKYRDR